MITKVYNLSEPNSFIIYSLPPRMAVVAAYEQHAKNNYNTWTYNYIDHPELLENDNIISCGNYSSFKTLS